MEHYETASIGIVAIEEDVITSSEVRCEPYYNHRDELLYWVIYYPDGHREQTTDTAKPSVCP